MQVVPAGPLSCGSHRSPDPVGWLPSLPLVLLEEHRFLRPTCAAHVGAGKSCPWAAGPAGVAGCLRPTCHLSFGACRNAGAGRRERCGACAAGCRRAKLVLYADGKNRFITEVIFFLVSLMDSIKVCLHNLYFLNIAH